MVEVRKNMDQEQRKKYYTPELKKIGTVKELTLQDEDSISASPPF
jgi:hypothetical protein